MIHFQNLTFTYPDASQPAIRQVNLNIERGEFVLVSGASGSGKSTLLRCINGLVPHFSGGSISGSLRVNGLNPLHTPPETMSKHVGFVFQDPETQLILDNVEDEIAFALENAAMPRDEILARIEMALSFTRLLPLRRRALETLSGGERQRVALAAMLALQPEILVLDEPTSQLDPGAAEELLEILLHLSREARLTILMAEHRLERVLPFVTRMVHMEVGMAGVQSGPPQEVLKAIDLAPPVIGLGKRLGWEPLPLSVESARPYARQVPLTARTGDTQGIFVHSSTPSSAYIQAEALEVSYGGTPALTGISLALHAGEILALMGANGAGKTTLLRCLVGLTRPQRGRVLVAGADIAAQQAADICRQVGYLPQDPNSLLFADTVIQELEITLRNHGLKPADYQPEVLLARLGLTGVSQRYPRDLSVGQKQRVALAAILITRPSAVLLDEPTRGMDYVAKAEFIRILRELRSEGKAILLATHDVEMAAQLADRVVLLEKGDVIAQGKPSHILSSQPRFTPQIAQLFPGTGWLTEADALAGLGFK